MREHFSHIEFISSHFKLSMLSSPALTFLLFWILKQKSIFNQSDWGICDHLTEINSFRPEEAEFQSLMIFLLASTFHEVALGVSNPIVSNPQTSEGSEPTSRQPQKTDILTTAFMLHKINICLVSKQSRVVLHISGFRSLTLTISQNLKVKVLIHSLFILKLSPRDHPPPPWPSPLLLSERDL